MAPRWQVPIYGCKYEFRTMSNKRSNCVGDISSNKNPWQAKVFAKSNKCYKMPCANAPAVQEIFDTRPSRHEI
eukprot:7069913-Karenia_brevis.AAC.1